MKMIALVLALSMFSNAAFAECDFSTGISKLPNGNYEYTKECHVKVGETVQDNKVKDEQIEKYKKAIDLKDLAITRADQRAQLWMDTSFKLEDNIQKMNNLKQYNQWIYFGMGVLTTFAAGYAAAKLAGH